MTEPHFVYRRNQGPTQTFLPFEPRSETTQLLLLLPRSGTALFHFGFADATPTDPVTPRFLLSDGELLLEGTTADGSDGHQLYLIGHGQVIPKGIVGRITGTASGQGEGQDLTYDLAIEAFDPLLSEGITGNTTFRPSALRVEMLHGGSGPITYGATIMVGA